jgi:thymidylate synthase (FAD)
MINFEQSLDSPVTSRLSVPALDEIIGKPFPALDHGFVRVIDYMGGDDAIVQAARVSYGKGTKKTSQDKGLIRYLLRHRHTTPFEMCEIRFHIKLPIFVARQWIRHRTANVNEYSARYSILDKEFYVPDRSYLEGVVSQERVEKRAKKSEANGQESLLDLVTLMPSLGATAEQSATNRQGRGQVVSESEAAEALKSIEKLSASAYSTYLKLLNEDNEGNRVDAERSGLARELARIVLPTNFYTQWYWKIDLHNLLHFISLRAEQHAQYEIRVYAEILGDIVNRWVPNAWQAFLDYRRDAVQLSAQELALIKRMLKGESPSKDQSGLSAREWKEFCHKFDLVEDTGAVSDKSTLTASVQ